MRSFIFSFKAIFLAAAVVATIEFLIATTGAPHLLYDSFFYPPYDSNFLELAYFRQENPIKVVQEIKVDVIHQLAPEFVQVGDSSGFHGPLPLELEKYINSRYVIMNCCADMGYAGHRYVAEAVLKRAPTTKYIIFYVTPLATPLNFGNLGIELATSFRSAFVSNWTRLDPPSLSYRIDVTNFVYYGHFVHSISGNPLNPDRSWEAGQAVWLIVGHGWAERTREMAAQYHMPPPPVGTCDFREAHWFDGGPDGPPIEHLYPELSKLAAMGRRWGVRIILVFNPVSCEEGKDPNALTIEREISRFRHDNPEVIMPFPFITTWPADLFADAWHLLKPGSQRMAETLGPVLRRVIDDPLYRGVATPSVEEVSKALEKAAR